jgi:DNA polymerase delta subunit 2
MPHDDQVKKENGSLLIVNFNRREPIPTWRHFDCPSAVDNKRHNFTKISCHLNEEFDCLRKIIEMQVLNNGADESFESNWNLKPDEFMSPPPILSSLEVDEIINRKKERKRCSFYPHYECFLMTSENEADQYFQLYSNRLQQFRSLLIDRIEKKFENGGGLRIEKTKEIELRVPCILVGTLFKEMPLRPTVLKQYAQDRAILPVPTKSSFVSDKDSLYLEDEYGRVKLVGTTFSVHSFVTGICVAVKGTEVERGEFEVEELIFAGYPPQNPITLKPDEAEEEGVYVALLSGLKIGSKTANPLHLNLLLDYFGGHLGSSFEQNFVASIVRVIIAGNIICSEDEIPGGLKLRDQTKRFNKREQSKLAECVQHADSFLESLATALPVDVLPGETDPTNYALPQQPLSRILFPRSSSKLTNIHFTPNPYQGHFHNDIYILGHSGQPLNNMTKYMVIDNKLDLMERTLEWRHIAPTAPDSLGCIPFKGNDPFILEKCPHIYFAGNQETYASRIITGSDGQIVRLILVPSFAETHTIVLVNLRTLNCHPITFTTYNE